MPELSENNGIKWMSSMEVKFEEAKDKKPTAEKLERLRREKVGILMQQQVPVGV